MKIMYISGINNSEKYGYFNAVFYRYKELKKINNIKIDCISFPIIDGLCIKIIKRLISLHINPNIKNEESDILYYPYKKTILDILLKFLNINLMEIIITKKIEQEIINNNYDFIHVHWGYPYGYIVAKLAQKYSIPFALHVHGSDIHTHPYKNKSIMEKTVFSINTAYVVFTVSESLKNTILTFNKIHQKNINVTFNGIYLNESLSKKIQSKKHIVFIGLLTKQKGADLLIPIFENIQNIDLTIIGNGDLLEQIKEEIKVKKLSINILGYKTHTEIKQCMNNFDLLIMPSRNEGFGLTALEAYSYNIPVIASNVGGLKELVVDKDFLIEMDDDFIKKFSSKIITFYQNYPYEKLANNHYLDYAKQYTWESIVKNELKGYPKL